MPPNPDLALKVLRVDVRQEQRKLRDKEGAVERKWNSFFYAKSESLGRKEQISSLEFSLKADRVTEKLRGREPPSKGNVEKGLLLLRISSAGSQRLNS